MGIKQRKGERERKKSHLIKVKEQVLFLDLLQFLVNCRNNLQSIAQWEQRLLKYLQLLDRSRIVTRLQRKNKTPQNSYIPTPCQKMFTNLQGRYIHRFQSRNKPFYV